MTALPELHSGQSFSGFCDTVAQSIITADVLTDRPDTFRGLFNAGFSRDVHVLDIVADAHAVQRTQRLVKQAPQTFLKFSVVEKGSALIVQDGRETLLGPGDMVIYDTNRPYTLAYEETGQMSIIMFPKEQLDIPNRAISTLTARKISSTHRSGAIVRPFLSSLSSSVNELGGFQARRLYRSAIELIGAVLDENLESTVPDDETGHLLNAIYHFIDDHIGDAELNPQQIAAAHFISVRNLHLIFQQQQTTVASLIRTRRLQYCHDDIVNPLLADRTITSIALSYGFRDPAHFSRLFREYFRVTPTEMRKRHLGI